MIVAGLVIAPYARSQVRTEFSGIPSIRVSEGGTERVAETLSRSQAVTLGTVISEIGGRYYWATRGNKEMLRVISGVFITYVAIDGAGYVRVINPAAKAVASTMSSTEAKFEYVEHMLLGLRSVTYYGNVQ